MYHTTQLQIWSHGEKIDKKIWLVNNKKLFSIKKATHQCSLIKSLVFDKSYNFVWSSLPLIGLDVVSAEVNNKVGNVVTRVTEIKIKIL